MTAELPSDLAAEQVVLGALMSGASMSEVGLASSDFWRPAHQLIFEALAGLAKAKSPTDPVAVATELRRLGHLTRMGGAPYLHTCLEAVPAAAQAGWYARILLELAERRRLIQGAERLRQAALDPGCDMTTLHGLSALQPADGRPADAKGAGLRVTPVSAIRVKSTEWLWHNRVPIGALTLLPGREGTGKSTAGAWLAAKVTRGTLPGAYFGIPKGVFYAAREDDWERTIAPRLIAAGADTSLVYRIDVEVSGENIELVLPAHVELLRDGIRKHDVALLFLDPLMSTIAAGLDTHKDSEARRALEPLAGVAMDTDSSVVGLAHFSKALTTDALNLVMASKAFTAVPRAVIGMARDTEADEDNAVVLSQIKSNLGPLDIPSLKFTFQQVTIETEDGRGAHVGRLVEAGETDRSVTDILAGRGDEADQDTWNAAAWWLYDYVTGHGGEAKALEILADGKKAGHSKDSLKRASQKLKLRKRTDGFQGPSLWTYDATHSEQPKGQNPKGAKGARQTQTENQTLPLLPLGDAPKKRSRRATGETAEVVPIRKPEAER